jgi:hypothetical protein
LIEDVGVVWVPAPSNDSARAVVSALADPAAEVDVEPEDMMRRQ